MTTLDKLRALHQEVCYVYRTRGPDPISEAEAEILNLGFLILESVALLASRGIKFTDCFTDAMRPQLSEYLQRVHSHFDSDADIRITEVPHNE